VSLNLNCVKWDVKPCSTNRPTNQSQCVTVFCSVESNVVFVRSSIQGDHLSGKTGNVREFETCQGNVRGVVNSQGNVREKILSWKMSQNCSLLDEYFIHMGI